MDVVEEDMHYLYVRIRYWRWGGQVNGNKPDSVVDIDNRQIQANGNKPAYLKHNDASRIVGRVAEDIDDEEVIGIITLEDVFEELLQGSILCLDYRTVNYLLTVLAVLFLPFFIYLQLIKDKGMPSICYFLTLLF